MTGRARSTELSPREREVLALVGTGLTSREIARRMERAPATVDSEVRSACAKLCATTRMQAAVMAASSGGRDDGSVLSVVDLDADGRRLLELLAEGNSLAVAAKTVH